MLKVGKLQPDFELVVVWGSWNFGADEHDGSKPRNIRIVTDCFFKFNEKHRGKLVICGTRNFMKQPICIEKYGLMAKINDDPAQPRRGRLERSSLEKQT